MLTRRQLLGAAGAGGSAALLAACGGDEGSGGASREELAARDLRLIGSALDLEHTLLAAYAAGAPLLRGDAARYGRAIVEHERAHADRLTAAIERLGGKPNPPKTREEYARGFPAPSRPNTTRLGSACSFALTSTALFMRGLQK